MWDIVYFLIVAWLAVWCVCKLWLMAEGAHDSLPKALEPIKRTIGNAAAKLWESSLTSERISPFVAFTLAWLGFLLVLVSL